MKRTFLFLVGALLFTLSNAQEIKLSHTDVTYFVDTIFYDLNTQLPDGIYKIHYDQAKTKLDCTGEIKNQKRINKWTWFYDTGIKRREVMYQEGVMNGIDNYYYPDGKQCATITYKSGVKNGFTLGWYLNGNKQFDGEYLNGIAVGKWIFYNEDGSILKEEQH